MGCPIRIPTDQPLPAGPRHVSSLATSFIAARSHRHPPDALLLRVYSRSLMGNSLSQHKTDTACFLSQSWIATLVSIHRSPYRSKNNTPRRLAPPKPCLDKQSAQNATPRRTVTCPSIGSRKEVFQPHLPVRLPCYDLALVISLTLNSALQQLSSGPPNFHGLTGGVYKVRERIHRNVADLRLLAIPTSCRRVAACNPN